MLQDAAGFEIFFAQGGLALDAGALVEVAIDVDQALRKGVLIVRVGVDDAIGVCGVREGEREADRRNDEAKNGGGAHRYQFY